VSSPIIKRALLIGTETYQDSHFAPLPCTRADTALLRHVLEHPAIGAFDGVEVVPDPTARTMREAITAFLEGLGRDELGLLYISGHGVRLSYTTGQFFFIASDTELATVERTGVGASFVNEQLEQCRAPQKVAILHCCQSGGFSLGFRTRDAKSASNPSALLNSRGVYIISSSGADESSYGGGTSASDPLPSVFTEELVDALRTGRGDTGNDGIVSVDELFHYVNQRVRKRKLTTPQIPAFSADKVNSRIDLARCYVGPPLPPVATPQAPQPDASLPPTPGAGSKSPQELWRPLLDYYRKCIKAPMASMPLMSIDDADERYVCLPGTERLLSGDLDDTGSIPLPEEAADLVEQAVREDAELWYGYPAVVLMTMPSGESYRTPRLAPLFIRQVEVVEDAQGPRLKPYGEPRPHRQLVAERIGAAAAQEMISTYQSHWHGGMHNQLVQEVRVFLHELTLRDVQPLRPDDLEPSIDARTPTQGARNAAVLFLVSHENQASVGLLKDLDHIADNLDDINCTALGSLLDVHTVQQKSATAGWQQVAPLLLNEGQQDVLRSAMTHRLTVATGPPGTGKTQLVANLVATAVSNGQKVLVASTNNRAVNEVWKRCEDLVPGCVVRTGSKSGEKNYQEEERQSLQKLHDVPPADPGDPNVGTAKSRLFGASTALDSVVAEIAKKAALERELLRIAEIREAAAKQLDRTPKQLRTHFDDCLALDDLARRARRAANARLFGRWRRSRFLRKLRWNAEPSTDVCSMIHNWAKAEHRWRTEGLALSLLPDDDAQKRALEEQHENVRERSRQLLESAVRTAARAGKQKIRSLIDATAHSDWAEVRSVLEHVRGWAVTNLSVRQFPPDPRLFDLVIVDEASQCSIPQVFSVLFRAKRALLIGDPMQLAPVIALKPAQEAEIRRDVGISASQLDKHRLTYHRHSAFHAFETSARRSLLLDEHFRCHPAIAAVSNKQFYGGKLTVLTDVAKLRRLPRREILWAHIPGDACRRRGGSWVNEAEVERVTRSVEYLLEQLPTGSNVGVVTPFKAQATMLRQHWNGDDRVEVGTVHTFQGAERDAMVFSLVAGKSMRPNTRRWLRGELNLWNVAITRARSHLVLVGDRDFWLKEGGIGQALVNVAEEPPEDRSNELDALDPLLNRLDQQLNISSNIQVKLLEILDGYDVDAVVLDSVTTTAVLLDRGHSDIAPARHLRLQYERQRLLAEQDTTRRVVRIPAWRLFDDHQADLLAGTSSLE
jgi:RecA/RadA recombinase